MQAMERQGMFRRFLRSDSGNFAIIAALASIPLVGGMGLAVDYSLATKIRNSLQSAADAAALAVVKETKGDFSEENEKALEGHVGVYLSANADISDARTALQLHPERMSATVSAEIDQELFFPMFGESWNIPVVAEAALMERNSICLLALGSTGTDFSVSGSASFEAPGCRVHSNSSSSKSMTQSGASSASAKEFCTAGRPSGKFTPAVKTDCAPLPDPFSGLKFPASGTVCDSKGETLGGGHHTLYPGTYCGGISVQGTAKVTMAPGTYILRDGGLVTSSNTRLQGDDVAIILQGSAYFSFEAGSSVTLNAATTGDFAGIVIAQDGANSVAGESRVHAGGSVELTGSVYLPKQAMVVSGGGDIGITAPQTAFVVDSFKLTGNGSVALRLNLNSNFKTAGYDPTRLGGGSDARLVR